MSETALPPPSELRKMFPEAVQVAKVLQDAGFTCYFAGGCVRDMLLGRTCKDIDIASSARPDQVEDLFPHTHAIGKSFGVIQVVVQSKVFEVATFRQDLDYMDGRRPDGYEPSTPEADASRRDFTINGMFIDPNTGELIDFVNGLEDIKLQTLRAIGDPDIRFQEDHLRLLRAVRFASVLEFEIEKNTWLAIRNHAALLSNISVERIRTEFVRMLTESKRAGDGLVMLFESGLLEIILPEILPCIGCEQPPEFHPEGDVWQHSVMMLNELEAPSEALALSVLLHDIGKPPTRTVEKDRVRFQGHAQVGADIAENWMTKMKFSKALRQEVVGLVYRHMDMMNVPHMRKATLRKIVARDCFEDEVELHRIDCLCSNGITASTDRLLEAREAYEKEAALPKPLITGHDLLAMGVEPGPELGKWKQKAYDQQLEDEHADPESLKAWLLGRLETEGGNPGE